MNNKQLESLVINKLTNKTTKIIDGKEVTISYSRLERDIYQLIIHTAFIYMKRISGDSAYKMAVRIVKYLEKNNL